MASEPKQAKEPLPVLTADELRAAVEACLAYAGACGTKSRAEEVRDAGLGQIYFEIGLTAEQARRMTPEELSTWVEKRQGTAFAVEAKAHGQFAFKLGHQGKHPAWKGLFVREAGPVKTTEAEARCPVLYSYLIVDGAGDGLVVL
jgi:hypothetical protein